MQWYAVAELAVCMTMADKKAINWKRRHKANPHVHLQRVWLQPAGRHKLMAASSVIRHGQV